MPTSRLWPANGSLRQQAAAATAAVAASPPLLGAAPLAAMVLVGEYELSLVGRDGRPLPEVRPRGS